MARAVARRRIGILGGTFNPPHLGHLLCASEAADQLGLDEVQFMPVAQPPHKALGAATPDPVTRAALCDLAVSDDARFTVSRLEVDRGGPSYTVETLRALAAAEPDADLTLIVGGDMATTLPTWREPHELLAHARIAVAARPGFVRADLIEHLCEELGPVIERIDSVVMPLVDISSSEIRRRVARGQSIRYLVTEPVCEQITALGLYRGSNA